MKSKKLLIVLNLFLFIFGGPVALLVGGLASFFLYKILSLKTSFDSFFEQQGQYDHSTGHHTLFEDDPFDHSTGHHSLFEDDPFESNGSSSNSSMDFSDGSILESSFSNADIGSTFSGITDINPATGLPMVGDGIGGVDVGGSPYGIDVHDTFHSGIHDSFGSSLSDSIGKGFDDSFSSSFNDSSRSGGINNDW